MDFIECHFQAKKQFEELNVVSSSLLGVQLFFDKIEADETQVFKHIQIRIL